MMRLFLGIPVIIGVYFYFVPELLLQYGIFFFEMFITLEGGLYKLLFTSELQEALIFDYIIVGAGTAGSLIASNLSRNSNNTILVIEAGSYPSIFHDIPALAPLFHGTQYDWQFKTEPQFNSCGAMKSNQCKFPLGKGLGGSSLINNMIWHRGMEYDYSGWFEDPTDYDYKRNIEPLFFDLEKQLQPTPISFVTKLGKMMENINEIGEIKFFKPLVLQKFGKRFTTYDYAKQMITFNTKFISNAIVKKLNFEIADNLRASGVTFEINSKVYSVISRKGIILSAGAIGTPTLLLQSGIGPCDELKKLNIDCLNNLPWIGKNLQDHVATGMSLFQFNESLNMNVRDLLKVKNIYQYLNPFNPGRGPLSTVGCEVLGFSNDNKIGYMFMPADITSDNGIKLRHVMNIKEKIWENYFEKLSNVQTFSIITILLHPKSRGFIKLRKINSKYEPVIDPQYLSDNADFDDLLRGIQLTRKLILTIMETLNINLKFNEQIFPGCENSNNENDYWKCYLKKMSFGIYHPAGTCKMGHNDSSVVDYNFKVHNIKELYIVDASVMPSLPSGNPNAAVALLAKKFLEDFTTK